MEFSDSSRLILSVAIPRPINRLFTYRLPAEFAHLAQPGRWAKVPFGKGLTHAFIVELPKPVSELPPGLPESSLKNVASISSGEPVFSEETLALCRWVHEYYFAPLGEVLSCAVPALTLQERKRSSRVAKLATGYPKHALTPAQQNALEIFDALRKKGEGGCCLLHGVTGSGKTEVYLELAKRALADGKGVLILVPEIALTSHLHHRFESGLETRVGLWHSAVSAGKRTELLNALRRGELKVLVGARSSIFAPVQNLGLLIVDEEHDNSYKQEDRVRYNARDIAVVRGKLSQSLVVLGSATPSLESRERATESRYVLAELPDRVGGGILPSIEIVDLKVEDKVEGVQAPLSKKVIAAIEKTIAAGEQVIVYLNRRGFASFLLCKDCGAVRGCPQCSISLTLYKKPSKLTCHVCGHREEIPPSCSVCNGLDLVAMGAGTESLELDLPRLIPEAKISRLDRDQITSVKRLEKVLEEFRSKQTNVLLGTQMLVKGHDFPEVTLVVVVLADALFRWPDFRASERAYQVLKQVSGRAGRREKRGTVLVQAYDTEHYVVKALRGEVSEKDFLETERTMRKALSYPPFGRLAKLRFESSQREEAVGRSQSLAKSLLRQFASDLVRHGISSPELEVLGPSEALLEKIKGVYRWDILIKVKKIQTLQKVIFYSKSYCDENKWQFLIDVDPYGV